MNQRNSTRINHQPYRARALEMATQWLITGWTSPATAKHIKRLAKLTGTTLDAVVEEARETLRASGWTERSNW